MHSKQFWILALLLIQVIFLTAPAFTFPPARKSHASNTKAMVKSNQEMAMKETTPVSSSPSFDYKPKEDEGDASKEEIEKYLAAKESYTEAVDTYKQFYNDYQGLEDLAYYLSYKMPRKVWNSIEPRGKSTEDYVKVLDPKRVGVYFKDIHSYSKNFEENQPLGRALGKINPAGEPVMKYGREGDDQKETPETPDNRLIPRPADVDAHVLPSGEEDSIDLR